MTRNDSKERKHIRDNLIKAAQNLESTKKISADFTKRIYEYEPTGEGVSRIITNKLDDEFHLPIIKINNGKLEYYVACFSTNSMNLHIMREFCAPYRIAFKPEFSMPDVTKNIALNSVLQVQIRNYYNELRPFSILKKCFLDYSIRRVVYEDDEKTPLLEEMLIDAYENYNTEDPQNTESDLQTIYSLYEAFFKSINYKKEEEVRFVIRLPQGFDAELLKREGIDFDNTKDHLYLPVDRNFVDSCCVAKCAQPMFIRLDGDGHA